MSGLSRRGALIPFEAGGGVMMALIVAAMSFLACFALVAALGASRVANAWTDGLAGAATVRIADVEGENAKRLGLVLDILNSSDGVIKAEPLSDDEVSKLLAPWFGAAPEMAELPAPAIIAVAVDPEDEPDSSIVQARLDGAVAGAVYDDHGRWRGRAAKAAESVRAVALGALGVAALAIAAVVVLAVRTGLAAQRHVIAALRLAGAEDRYVAGLYQRRFFWIGVIGGALGCVLAVFAFLGFDAASSVTGVLPALQPPKEWPLIALGVVLFTAAVAVLAARVAVFATLRRAA